jgi:hypothetical protein
VNGTAAATTEDGAETLWVRVAPISAAHLLLNHRLLHAASYIYRTTGRTYSSYGDSNSIPRDGTPCGSRYMDDILRSSERLKRCGSAQKVMQPRV